MKFAFAPEATPLAGYTIKRAIDRGGFGEVYYALSDSGKEVALKLLQRNQQVELRGVSQCLNLKHPNLVTIFDIRTDAEGDHWVVMEYVSGKSLEAVLDEHPKGLPLSEVEDWLAGIAAGTAFLHDRGIVHRDLKPANVFRENGVVKIGDVGLSGNSSLPASASCPDRKASLDHGLLHGPRSGPWQIWQRARCLQLLGSQSLHEMPIGHRPVLRRGAPGDL